MINSNSSRKRASTEPSAQHIKTKKLPIGLYRLKTGLTHGILVLLAILLGLGIGAAINLKKQSKILKTDLKSIISCLKEGNTDLAEFAISTFDSDLEVVRVDMDTPALQLAARLPVFNNEISSLQTAVDSLSVISDELLKPATKLIKKYPVKEIKTDAGINDYALTAYLSFLCKSAPRMYEISEQLKTVKFKIADSDGSISEYISEYIFAAELLNGMTDTVIEPAVRLLSQYPASQLKNESGINFSYVGEYLRYLQNAMPVIDNALTEMSGADLAKLYSKGNVKTQIIQLSSLIKVADKAVNDVLSPLERLMREQPLENLNVGFGFDVRVLSAYIDLLPQLVPEAEELISELKGLDVSELDKNGKLPSVCEKLEGFLDLYRGVEDYLPLLKYVIGDGEDKTYVFAAQNSSELRASGGFPGAVATISVSNGILSIGEFSTVKNSLAGAATGAAAVSREEQGIFGMHTGLAWDACFIPDFERVGSIWAAMYERNKGVHVDGVLSMTPPVIQDVLAAFDESIALSDGTVIDGTNAARVLQHDIYSKYFGADMFDVDYSNEISDNMFSETAIGAVQLVLGNLNAGNIIKLIDVFRKNAENRSVMLWMADEEAQKICVSVGCSGTLNRDENNPVTAVFLSGYLACKMGWYLDLDYEISEPTVNADASRTYTVTVNLSNNITYAEADSLSYYVTADAGGTYPLFIHYFAPAGGKIEDISFSTYSNVQEDEYQGLQDLHIDKHIDPGQIFTATYKVTTAPGVETPLKFVSTPTLTAYH